MPSVYIKTYGCQMNERDSEALAARLLARGYTLASSEADADVILLNTCSVRDHAEQTALNKMAALVAENRRRRQPALLGFLGCMAQRRGQALLDGLPDVDLVLGTHQLHRADVYLQELLAGQRERVVDVSKEPTAATVLREHLGSGNGPRAVTAYVSIMQGCNQRCAFCIVPTTRGPERSRSPDDILDECRQLVADGVKEITLLGQIVTSYGRGQIPRRDGKSAFVQLLEAIHALDGLERIRFTAPHPKGYGEDLIAAYGRLPKLAEHAHIPVQSGSDRVLRLMRRGYTRARFLELAHKLRAVQPRLGLTTDLIVGFPGETEADFEDTLSLCREACFDNAFIFKYSPREGTPAATMPGALPRPVIEERHARALALVDTLARRNYEALIGQQVQVLVEGPSKKNPARLMGRTRCGKIVVFEGPAALRGRLVDVWVRRAGSFTLYGEPVATPA